MVAVVEGEVLKWWEEGAVVVVSWMKEGEGEGVVVVTKLRKCLVGWWSSWVVAAAAVSWM